MASGVLNVPPVSLIVVGVAIVRNRDKIEILVVIIVWPPIIPFIPSWLIESVPRWSFGCGFAS